MGLIFENLQGRKEGRKGGREGGREGGRKEGRKERRKNQSCFHIVQAASLNANSLNYLLSVCSLTKSLTACEVRAASRFYERENK